MWGSGSWRKKTVVCIACGRSLVRSEAREYDKYGDRWSRDGKRFEYLCKRCHRELCHLPRGELESMLVEIGADELSRAEFLASYTAMVEERYGTPEE